MEWAASLDSCKHVFSFVKVGDSTRLQLEVALKLDSACIYMIQELLIIIESFQSGLMIVK